MTNLHLNVTVSENGNVIANIYKVTAINKEGQEENLGYYSSKTRAEIDLKFWTEIMEYTNGRITWEILRLN